jgi:alpha-D-ribose 1-methylphosphonate 5-triphosphate synthase subunit PhnI
MAEVAQARSAWIDAELEMSTNRAQRVKWLRELVDNAVDMEEIVLAMADANAVGGDHASVAAAHAARFDAELRLAQELAVPAKAK